MSEKEHVAHLNFYDLLTILAKWRKLFIVNFLIAAVISVIVAFMAPAWYKATSVILPPAGGSSGLPSFLSKDLAGVAANFGLDIPSEQIYESILGSRTLKERIIAKFDLRSVYKMDEEARPEDLLEAFNAHYVMNTREDMAVEVSFEDKDPKRAADIANACVAELDNLYREITSRSAKNNRTYIERRLGQIIDSLSFYQDKLAIFQQENNIVSLSDQTTAMLHSAADLKAEQMAAEIELNVARHSLGESHSSVIQLQQTSQELGKKYESLIEGRESRLFTALDELPELGKTFAVYLRQVRIHTSLLEFVYPQFESARIQEERETANVQILDMASVPMKKARPSRRMIVMVASAASIFVTLVMILVLEYWKHLPERNREDWEKIRRLRKILRPGSKIE